MSAASLGRAVLEIVMEDLGLRKGMEVAKKELKGFQAAADETAKSLKSTGKSTKEFGEGLTTAVTLPVVAAVGSLVGLAMQSVKTGDAIAKGAKEAGIGAQAYQELTYAVAQIAKVSDDEASKAFNKLALTIGDAAKGSDTARDALYQLGFTQKEIASGTITTEEAFTRLTVAMGESKTTAQAAALAGELVGDKLGVRLAGPLRESAGEVSRLRGEFKELGLGMSDENLKAAEDFADEIDQLERQFGALASQVGAEILPLLRDDLFPWIRETAIPFLRDMGKNVGDLIKWFSGLPTPVKATAAVLIALAAAAGPVLVIAGQLISASSAVIGAFGAQGVATLALAGTKGVLAKAMGALTASFGLYTAGIAAGAGIAYLHEQHLEKLKTLGADVEKSTAAITEKEEALSRARAHGNEKLEYKLNAELRALKAGRDAAVQAKETEQAALAEAEARKKLTDQASEQAKEFDLRLGTSLKKLEQGQKAAGKEAAEHARELEQQRSALSSLGIVTETQVNKRLKELAELVALATREGVPLKSAVRGVIPELYELADAAKRSGIDMSTLNAELATANRIMGQVPSYSTPIVDVYGQIAGQIETISGESMAARAQADLLRRAYEELGITTQAELNSAADAAKKAYEVITRSGTATADELKAARERVLEAERAAGRETVNIWTGQIWPAIKDVARGTVAVVSDGLAEIIVGAVSFKDAFVDIWHSIRSALANIFSQILQSFINTVITGILGSLRGQQGAFSGAFAGLFGGGGSGGGGGILGGMFGGGGFPGMGGGVNYAQSQISGVAGKVGGGLNWGNIAGGGLMAAGGIMQLLGAKGMGGNIMGGAQTGAGVGMMFGGPMGALIGGGIGLLGGAIKGLIQANSNNTKKDRESFAKQLGFMQLGGEKDGSGRDSLYAFLDEIGRNDLTHRGLNVIGKKDEAGNQQWMADVMAALEQARIDRGQMLGDVRDAAGGMFPPDGMPTGDPEWVGRLETAFRENRADYSGARVALNFAGKNIGEVFLEDIIVAVETNDGGGAPVGPNTRFRKALGVPL